MRKRQITIISIITLLFIISLMGCTPAEKVKVAPKLNAKAPNFSASNIDGENIALDKIKSNVIIISFWKIESPSALRQLRELQSIKDKYNDDVKIFAVNVQDKDSEIKKFIDKNNYDFDIINDKDGKINNLYALSIFPTTFLIDNTGIIKEIKKYDSLTDTNPVLVKLNS